MPQIVSMTVGNSGVFERRLLPTPSHVSFLTSWTVGGDSVYCCYRMGALPPSPSFHYTRIGLGKVSRCPELPDLGTAREARLGSSKARVMGLLSGRATWPVNLIDETVSAGPLGFSFEFRDKRRLKTSFHDLVCRGDGKVQVLLLEDDRLTGWDYRGTFDHEVKWDVAFRGLIDRHAPMIASCVGGQLYVTFNKGGTFALDLDAAAKATDHSVRARRISDETAELVVVDRDADRAYASTGSRLWDLAAPTRQTPIERVSLPESATKGSAPRWLREAVSAVKRLRAER